MPMPSFRQKQYKSLLLRGVSILFVVLTLVGTLPVFFSPNLTQLSAGRVLLLVSSSIAYLLMGIFGWHWLVESRRRLGALIYFSLQIGLVSLILWLAIDLSGTIWIIIMPIAGQSVGLPRWGTLLVPLLLLSSFSWILARVTSWNNTLNATLSIGAAMLFTLIFTYVTLREESAREEIERLAQALQSANQLLREYSVQAEELAITRERNRLAREIHDSLGHFLTVINVQLQAAQAVLDTDPARARSALEKSQMLAQDGLQEVRRSVTALRESPLDRKPLPEVIDELLAALRASGMVTELTVLGTPQPLDPRIGLTLYRVAQEGLTNVHKHARASRVDVTLAYEPETAVSLTIQDNGVGATATGGGFGLLGLQERIELLNGKMVVETAVSQGFTLHVSLPTGT